jgi:hypothetical protein
MVEAKWKEARMPSPFSGMDPYLEGEMWQEFHETLAGAIRAQLLPQLAPKYVALLAKRYVIDRPALGVFDLPASHTIYPDVHIAETPGRRIAETRHNAVIVDEPATEVASFMDVPQLSVEIRDIAQRRLVTIIESLSPANKYGEGKFEYNQRRVELLRTETHILEIDLLRQGARIPLQGDVPPAQYYVYLSRSQRRPFTQVWAIKLPERLPTVPVPLLPPDPDVVLDIQAAIRACFDLVGYERLLDYGAAPPPPELDAAHSAWMTELLRERGA